MKRLAIGILALGISFGGLRQASAALQLRLSDGTTTVTVVDEGPGDSAAGTVGEVEYVGPVGANWTVDVTTGLGSPWIGGPALPTLDIGTANNSIGAGTLTIDLTEDGFTAGGPSYMQIGGTSVGTVTYQVWTDPANQDFAKTTLIGTVGPLTPPSGGSFSGASNGVVAQITPYSITAEAVIQHPNAGHTGFDASFAVTPPPCSCTLTFTSPAAITNCASDVIPDVVAVEDCGGGLSNTVPVTFVGASTNGSCPSIITRTNTATDNCGNVYTNVQTITVNCLGSICGHIFADCDGSGDLTTGDVGIPHIIVSLLDASNHVISSTSSDTNGVYCFGNLAGGNYVVAISPPSSYCETAASTSYHWKDNYGRTCWNENDGYIHCLSSGIECWWDKSNTCHWKDSYNRDCWKDNWGYIHCQPLSYKSCNAQTNNNQISVTLTNCTSKTDVDFAYTGTKPSISVCVTGPSYVKCGQTYSYTCTITNTGNVCFTGGNICNTIGNCSWGYWNYGCNTYNYTCPPLSPGQSCTFTQKCTFNSWNYGTVGCQSSVTCSQRYGNSYGQSICYSQCGW